jgi:hypothetical protein
LKHGAAAEAPSIDESAFTQGDVSLYVACELRFSSPMHRLNGGRRAVADRVGEVDGRTPLPHDRLDHAAQKIPVASGAFSM